jgi:hypothetical protein
VNAHTSYVTDVVIVVVVLVAIVVGSIVLSRRASESKYLAANAVDQPSPSAGSPELDL